MRRTGPLTVGPPAPSAWTSPWAWSAGALLVGAVTDLGLGDTGYVARNLALTGVALLAARRAGWGAEQLGLTRARLGAGLRWGAAAAGIVGAVVGTGVVVADALAPVGTLLSDQRAQLPAAALATAVLVRIPLGTALFEEVLFRGALLTAFRARCRPLVAEVASSVVFGLWHVAPTIVALRLNDVAPGSVAGLGAITGAVVVTAVGGLLFCRLRTVSGSLLAPILAHWATNAFGLLAAAAAG